MTREEEIESVIKSHAPCFWGVDGKSYLMKDGEIEASYGGFRKGVEWADKNPKSPWISVEDDLPCNHDELITTDGFYKKETVNVITLDSYEIIENNYMVLYDDGKWEWKYGAKPRYWMLIPKLPKIN